MKNLTYINDWGDRTRGEIATSHRAVCPRVCHVPDRASVDRRIRPARGRKAASSPGVRIAERGPGTATKKPVPGRCAPLRTPGEIQPVARPETQATGHFYTSSRDRWKKSSRAYPNPGRAHLKIDLRHPTYHISND